MTTTLETNKRVPTVSVLAVMLVLSANALHAATNNAAAVVNHSGNDMTNAVAPAQRGCAGIADPVRESVAASINSPALTTISSNAQTISADACCGEMRTFQSDFTSRANALTRRSSEVSAYKAVRFFSGAVISVGRSGDSAGWRDGEPRTFNRFPANVGLADGDTAARSEPRGLKLFSWSW